VASETTRWRSTGVFFDHVAIRFADGGGAAEGTVERAAARADEELENTLAASAYCGPEEFTFAAPVPGRASGGAYDGKADVIVVYRLSLDVCDHLN
jgi:hypothetical protein